MFDRRREETFMVSPQNHESHFCRKSLTFGQSLKLYNCIGFENAPLHDGKCI